MLFAHVKCTGDWLIHEIEGKAISHLGKEQPLLTTMLVVVAFDISHFPDWLDGKLP